MQKNKQATPYWILPTAILLGIFAGSNLLPLSITNILHSIAELSSTVFINLLQLVSLPIIFLAMLTTISGLKDFEELKLIGSKVLRYTLLTTIAAATIALILFVWLNPSSISHHLSLTSAPVLTDKTSYMDYLIKMVPSNFVQTFAENNVIGTLFLATSIGLSTLSLPKGNRDTLHQFFSSSYAAIFKMTTWILKMVPLAIWAFTTLFTYDLIAQKLDIGSLSLYLACVVLANLIQALFVLPAFLKAKGISPKQAFDNMLPALQVAFWSKSSSAALPVALDCAKRNAGVSERVANISFPLCISINMNGCAAFILTTVLFVAGSHGMVFSSGEMIAWIFIATLAAIGNAGVPMGCYFLSSALLTSLGVPLHIMGFILPFYSLIDMLESAINVWSDACVTLAVAKDMSPEEISDLETPVTAEA